MPKMDVSTDGEAWDTLRDRLDRLRALADRPEVNLVDLGKAYQAVAGAMLEAARASGQSSARFEAVVRALDLKTPKSKLRAFLE
ncbi:MAG TPA: hypothetical protein RMH99_11900 [Sandaracinaceae bacterium LLY-WYZ-13_1]|nr:hypothetical protein [Sandaracinaceae bacterium LLY-WYZ-13_1]